MSMSEQDIKRIVKVIDAIAMTMDMMADEIIILRNEVKQLKAKVNEGSYNGHF